MERLGALAQVLQARVVRELNGRHGVPPFHEHARRPHARAGKGDGPTTAVLGSGGLGPVRGLVAPCALEVSVAPSATAAFIDATTFRTFVSSHRRLAVRAEPDGL